MEKQKNYISERIGKLRVAITLQNIDALMVLIPENRRYLSGFTAEDSGFDETSGALFITRNRLIIATDSRFTTQAKIEAPLFEIVQYKKGLIEELPKILESINIKRIGFEKIRVTIDQYGKIKKQLEKNNLKHELVETENLVEDLRVIKSEPEIKTIKTALLLAENAFKTFIKTIKPGMTEKEAAWGLEKEMRNSGAEAIAFPLIVASGPNSAMPHAIPGNRKFKKGEPILFDWGAKLDGFFSDISRTVILGEPDKTFEKVYQTVYQAQKKAIAAIKPGMSSKAVDKVARSYVENSEFAGKFEHGLGHGVGLAIHESPRLGPIKDYSLAPGMVFTIEPGIYLPEWGGVRIENMVVVRKDGAEMLNSIGSEF